MKKINTSTKRYMWFNPYISYLPPSNRDGDWEETTKEDYQEKLLKGYDTKKTDDGITWYNEIDVMLDNIKR